MLKKAVQQGRSERLKMILSSLLVYLVPGMVRMSPLLADFFIILPQARSNLCHKSVLAFS